MSKLFGRSFWTDRRGNVAVTFAFVALPLLFALGASVDYGYAVKARAKMNAAADAAALLAVTPQEMALSTTIAQTAATTFFNGQVSGISRISYDPTTLQISVTDQTVNNQRVRTATLKYQATSQNAFAAILKMPTITIGGTSTASASTSPNIDFYLMLDTSPSMAIPATQAGIDYMVAATPYQDSGSGCAFACHENYPARESGSATYKKPIFGNANCPDDPKRGVGVCIDNYTIARNAGIPLRIDYVKQAVSNLVDTASATASSTGAVYRMAGYTFDVSVANPIPLQVPVAATKTLASNGINMLVVDSENANNGDQNTVFDGTTGAFSVVSTAMSTANSGKGPGTGSNTTGDRPQQVLMIVTDGVADEPYNGNRIYLPLGGTTNTGSNMTDACTTIKANANVRIAVLYLTYNPLPLNNGNSWYAQKVSPIQNSISPTLQNCASTGLFYQVNTGGDVSAALTSLFQSAVKSAHLTN
jgi:Flp pilus assembly protein TadG